MKRLVGIIALLVAACAHPVPIEPVEPFRESLIEGRCRAIYPQGRWQLVHGIAARFAGGRQTFLTGVIQLSSRASRIHCVLMTLDGLVLFEAVDDGLVAVKRAVGPFDHPVLAEGLMADIRLMFFPPPGAVIACGRFAETGEGCRFRAPDGGVVDVTVDDDGWRIAQLSPPRTITASAVDPRGMAATMTLAAGGDAAYRLTITLIDAAVLDADDPPTKDPL